jgi:hypothetical protein
MISLTKKITAAVTSVALLFAMVAAPVAVFAAPTTGAGTGTTSTDINDNLCAGTNLNVNDKTCNAEDANDKVNGIIKTVITIFSLVVGVASVIMIILGGFKYITSGGDSGNVTGAKNTIMYAIIGLVVVALAQVIVRFVLNKATA